MLQRREGVNRQGSSWPTLAMRTKFDFALRFPIGERQVLPISLWKFTAIGHNTTKVLSISESLVDAFGRSWEMKSSSFASLQADPNTMRSCLFSIFPTASFLCLLLFIGSAFLAQDDKEKLFRWGLWEKSAQEMQYNKCKSQCRPPGSESLPKDIVSNASNLQMRPLWGSPKKAKFPNLFSATVGIKQKDMVDKMVRKFLSSDFVVMLFHYDGIVDEWKDLEWSHLVIHISAVNQTKWWFAKRFLHPDIVAEYSYIFLWDEDLGVEDFQPERYLAIVKDEQLEISQPALDPDKSEVHHQITARERGSNVHRRIYKSRNGSAICHGNSTTPPCTGYIIYRRVKKTKSVPRWIEIMAPVFSRAAWRCVWYMIQGDRTTNIGVVDSEYIVHYALPTLGDKIKVRYVTSLKGSVDNYLTNRNKALRKPHEINRRAEVRRQSYKDFMEFKTRWRKAAESDECWIDPYPQPAKQNVT
ncbi:hypothetical protein RHGRI_027180 [Rhododendron griersonianum]|uniref:Uncharacterized protein n=1 Tax=Rhododendron griersonianum TaxID=479676 RepID=A0AAV6IVD9_9ERIC|nr:hypothetical protein RHGRI_027180 [Rhododendron griersonianum]